jgi:hypothetical protein
MGVYEYVASAGAEVPEKNEIRLTVGKCAARPFRQEDRRAHQPQVVLQPAHRIGVPRHVHLTLELVKGHDLASKLSS